MKAAHGRIDDAHAPARDREHDSGGLAHFVVWPHRALGREGLHKTVTFVAVAMLPVGLVPAIHGLWPVTVMVVLSFAVFAIAFLRNGRPCETAELIDVLPGRLLVRARGRQGDQRLLATFDPYWARVEVKSDHYVENRLLLRQSGRSLEVGRCLSPEERIALARALKDTLARARMLPHLDVSSDPSNADGASRE